MIVFLSYVVSLQQQKLHSLKWGAKIIINDMWRKDFEMILIYSRILSFYLQRQIKTTNQWG